MSKIKKRGEKYKAAIICASWGAHRETALKLIEYYDVADILDVHESLGTEQLNEMLNRSRCNILLSLKEGSNRSLFESMFSNIPVIALKNNIGMNKDYINSSTGMLIDEKDLVDSLVKMQTQPDEYSPRQWAMNNISPEVTTDKLVKAISATDISFQPEEKDILVKTNDPEVAYLGNVAGVDRLYYSEEVLKLFTDTENSEKKDKLASLSQEFYQDANTAMS